MRAPESVHSSLHSLADPSRGTYRQEAEKRKEERKRREGKELEEKGNYNEREKRRREGAKGGEEKGGDSAKREKERTETRVFSLLFSLHVLLCRTLSSSFTL